MKTTSNAFELQLIRGEIILAAIMKLRKQMEQTTRDTQKNLTLQPNSTRARHFALSWNFHKK
jgi:hypothetical protein